jgi:putative phage-type endonuclease
MSQIETFPQGSPEWKAVRLGRVTASRVADVIAKTKSGPSASRSNYMAELICERLTGCGSEGFTNAAMMWGVEKEPDARAVYEFMQGVNVEQVGFVHHPTIGMAGASPDGLVGASGSLEIKCPNSSTHIETLLSGVVAGKYQTQIQWQLACDPAREWCDYVSFDPRLPAEMQIFIQRIQRDHTVIEILEKEVRAFLSELDAKIAELTAKFARAA